MLPSEPDASGDEHEVWFVGKSVVKIAHPDFFGLRVVYRGDEDHCCLPHEYLERWDLHNEIFGDDISFLGVLDTTQGMRMVISQGAIKGEPTSEEKIEWFFRNNGWKPFSTMDGKAWFDEERNLVVSDTHRGNLIETPDGELVPIDFRIQLVSGPILEAVRKMACG